jgi:hypothetical protein
MATTTNYSWSTPDDTALVKDGAAAIRSLGTAIDTTVFTNAGAAIAKTIVDAKGDLIVGTAADTVARLASSASNGNVLTVDTSTASGLAWAAPAGGGKLLQVVSATTTTATTIATTTFTDTTITATITPTSATSRIMVLVQAQVYAERSSSQCFYSARLVRGATTIHNIEPAGSYNFGGASSATIQNLFPMNWVDSPATTSATTYKVQGKVQSTTSSATTTWQNSGGDATSTIILLEIGA